MPGILEPIEANGQIGRTGLGYFTGKNKIVSGLIHRRFELLSAEEVIDEKSSRTVFNDDQRHEDTVEGLRPDIIVQCEGHRIIALVDTGSEITCISETLYNELKITRETIPMVPVKGFQVRGAVGQRSTRISMQVMLEIELVKGVVRELTFLVVPGLTRPMILGFDFMRQYQIRIQLDGVVGMYIKHGVEPIFVPFKHYKSLVEKKVVSLMCDSIQDDCGDCNNLDQTQIQTGMDIGREGMEKLQALLKKYSALFSTQLGRANCYVHKIVMQHGTPIVKRSYPIPYAYKGKLEEKLKEMEEMGIISRQSTPYSSPLTFTLKKDGSVRVLLDAREINKHMVPETEKPPMQLDVLNSFHGAKFITVIDLNNAYFQIPIDEQGKQYTGFTFDGKSYVYNVLPMGLKTSVGSFSRAMDVILGPEVREFCVNYLDDLAVITTGSLDVHLEHVEVVLQKLLKAGLTCNLQKCEFICKEVKMLGFIISTEGIRTDPDKIRAIREFPVPKKVKQVRAFLGLCNFYRRFIPDYNRNITPLCEILKKGRTWKWGQVEFEAFENLKRRFLETIMLHHPDFSQPYYVQTDCSGIGLAGVLYQKDEQGNPRILGFHSKALKGAELNWTTTEQEFYAVISTIKKFETYLRGSKFHILTDHKALLFVQNMKLYNSRVTRWILFLEQFDYTVEHVAGRLNTAADVLSRYLPSSEFIQEEKATCPEIAYLKVEANIGLNKKLEQLEQLQQEDQFCKEKIKVITQRVEVNPAEARFSIKRNVLHVQFGDKEVVVLPEVLREEMIQQVHLEMGHQGAYKIIAYIKSRMYWPHLARDVKEVVRKCHVCQLAKCNNFKYAGPCKSIVTKEIGDLVMADLYGPLPSGTMGYQYILVVQDSFSKFVKLYPLRRATASACIIKMLQFARIVKPKVVMTDNGKQFISKLWKEGLHELGVKTVYTTVRNPRPNTTERVNKELGRMFRTYCHERHRSWANKLPELEVLYNNTRHDSTGYTPCEVMYGKTINFTFDKSLRVMNPDLDVEKVREEVQKNLEERSKYRQQKFDSSHKLMKFQIGMLVKVRRSNVSSKPNKQISKFDLLYEGPYRISSIPFDNVYVLEDPETGLIRGKFNTIHLSRYYK